MEQLKKFIALIKRHLDVSVLVVPNNGTKLRRLSSASFFSSMAAYTALLFVLGFFAAVNFYPRESSSLSVSDRERIISLKEQVITLTRELESIKDSNRKIRNAIILADSNAFKTKKLNGNKTKFRGEGSIYLVYKKLVENLKEIQQESYYFIKPAGGFISRGFNPGKGHFGIDIVLKKDNPVYAAGNGYVSFADFTPEDGYMIIINHSDNFITVYKHCAALLKKQRDQVKQGEIIALSGSSGESSGPHLHFEIWEKGVPQNPEYFIN